MSTNTTKFHVVLPASLEKSSDGEWVVQGLASTPSRDQQGEVILQDGIDLTPIDQKKGVLNWDHNRDPASIIGTIDSYSKTPQGLFIKGRLFKNHTKAKAVYEIMSSLGKSDRGRMGLSVEGRILERGGPDGKIIRKCQINAVALTMNPVNQDSFADLAKSMNAADMDVEFDATGEGEETTPGQDTPLFTASQVLSLMEKALTAGAGYTKAPAERSGGEALSTEESSEELKKKKLKKMDKTMYKSVMLELLGNLQVLYPSVPRDVLWETVKDRLNKKFPELPLIGG